ncbi:MAG TPA: PIG-L deacetylase family protein [Terriglobales bacterium]|jgi:LmbE family N-acetylglucosaminyl deacetylase|nr:PIG-L deacetylase family protein [Terriglobales bacterium]
MPATELLLLTAHCDDGELWAGGTVKKFVQTGSRVVLAIANHDAQRRREAEKGAAVLGCEVWFRQSNDDLTQWTSRCLHEAQPEVLITHPLTDPHFEHGEVAGVVRKALTKSKQRRRYPMRWYYFDTYYSTEHLGIPFLIDISSHFDLKCKALKCHRSQEPAGLIAMARKMNQLHGEKIRVKYAEAFYPFSLLGRFPLFRDLP